MRRPAGNYPTPEYASFAKVALSMTASAGDRPIAIALELKRLESHPAVERIVGPMQVMGRTEESAFVDV
jgi:hypothetical protein